MKNILPNSGNNFCSFFGVEGIELNTYLTKDHKGLRKFFINTFFQKRIRKYDTNYSKRTLD